MEPSARNQEILALRKSGMTLTAIAEKHRITRERVRHICIRTERWISTEDAKYHWRKDLDRELDVVAVELSDKLAAISSQLDEIEDQLNRLGGGLDRPAKDIVFSTRARNCFECCGIETVSDLLCWTEKHFLRMPNVGRKTVREIRDALAEIGLDLPTVSDEERIEQGLQRERDAEEIRRRRAEEHNQKLFGGRREAEPLRYVSVKTARGEAG